MSALTSGTVAVSALRVCFLPVYTLIKPEDSLKDMNKIRLATQISGLGQYLYLWGVRHISPNINVDLWHRRKVSSLCLLHKMYYSNRHPLHSSLPGRAMFARNTRQAVVANSMTFSSIRFCTNQFARSFIPRTTKMWNGLPSAIVESSDLQTFKRGANSFLLSTDAT